MALSHRSMDTDTGLPSGAGLRTLANQKRRISEPCNSDQDPLSRNKYLGTDEPNSLAPPSSQSYGRPYLSIYTRLLTHDRIFASLSLPLSLVLCMVCRLQHALQHVPEVFPIGSLSLMGFPSQPSADIVTNKFPNIEFRHQILCICVPAPPIARAAKGRRLPDAGLRVI